MRNLKEQHLLPICVLLAVLVPLLGACADGGAYSGAIAYQRVVGESSQIYVMDPQGEVRTRVSQSSGWNFMPSWSPDGETVAYYSFNPGTQMTSVYGVDVTQAEFEQILLTDRATFDLEFGLLKWSPDGESILFHTIDALEIADIYQIDVDAGAVTDIFSESLFADYAPDWSPDGSQFVFASNRPDRNNPIYDLYLADKNGENLVQLTDNNTGGWMDTLPAWSPDGETIAFWRFNYILGEDFEDGAQGLWLVDAVSGEEDLLYEAPIAAEDVPPVWSPNGNYLAFLEPVDGQHVLRVLELDSGELLGIGEVLGEKRTVSWSPDSRALAFSNFVDSKIKMFILDIQSGELTEVLEADSGASIGDPHWGGN